MNNLGTDKLKADTLARYMEVKHLSDIDAAIALGRTRHAVNTYRQRYPECKPEAAPKPQRPADVPKPVRDDVRKVNVANVAGSSTQWGSMSVSLPKEPFEVPV